MKFIVSLFFLILMITNIYADTMSFVTNYTDNPIEIFWTAAGCLHVNKRIAKHYQTEVCKYTKLQPHSSGSYKFKSYYSDLEIKVVPHCIKKQHSKHHLNYSIYCPSAEGDWKLITNFLDHFVCRLKGHGRNYVKHVVIHDLSSFKGYRRQCYHN